MTFYSYLAVLVYFSTLSQCIVFLRSLVKLVEGNLLEWGQLLSREILWWLSNFLRGGQFSPGVFVREKIFPGGKIFLGGNCLGDNYQLSRGQSSRGQLSGGRAIFGRQFSSGAIVQTPSWIYCIIYQTYIYII